jgi:Na+-driven multidrug efflux pump
VPDDRQPAREQQIRGDRAGHQPGDRRPHCRAGRAEARERADAGDEGDVAGDVERGQENAEPQRRAGVAGVLLLRFIGSLPQSAEAQGAYAVGYTELFSFITWTSVGLQSAAATVAGQNLGAGKPERSIHGVHVAAGLGLGVAAFVGALFLAVPGFLLGLFGMTDSTVLSLGTRLLAFLSVSGLFVTVALTYTGGLQGTGDTRSPLYISLLSQIVVPLGLCALVQATRELQPADIWTAIVLGHVTRCALSVLRFRQGKWRGIRVDMTPSPAPEA